MELQTNNLSGKVALVTGAVTGLGRAIADQLLDEGCKVVLIDRNENQGTKTVEEFQQKYGNQSCTFFACDVCDEAGMDALFGKTKLSYGGLDIVCNNAGVYGEENWRATFAINMEAVFLGIRMGIKHMGKENGNNGGHIINTASLAGLQIIPRSPAYTAAKTAVVAMTRAFGSDLHFKRNGVQVNCICPERIDTDMWSAVKAYMESRTDLAHEKVTIPRKICRPEDVALGVLKLLRDGRNGSALKCLFGRKFEYNDFKDQL